MGDVAGMLLDLYSSGFGKSLGLELQGAPEIRIFPDGLVETRTRLRWGSSSDEVVLDGSLKEGEGGELRFSSMTSRSTALKMSLPPIQPARTLRIVYADGDLLALKDERGAMELLWRMGQEDGANFEAVREEIPPLDVDDDEPDALDESEVHPPYVFDSAEEKEQKAYGEISAAMEAKFARLEKGLDSLSQAVKDKAHLPLAEDVQQRHEAHEGRFAILEAELTRLRQAMEENVKETQAQGEEMDSYLQAVKDAEEAARRRVEGHGKIVEERVTEVMQKKATEVGDVVHKLLRAESERLAELLDAQRVKYAIEMEEKAKRWRGSISREEFDEKIEALKRESKKEKRRWIR